MGGLCDPLKAYRTHDIPAAMHNVELVKGTMFALGGDIGDGRTYQTSIRR